MLSFCRFIFILSALLLPLTGNAKSQNNTLSYQEFSKENGKKQSELKQKISNIEKALKGKNLSSKTIKDLLKEKAELLNNKWNLRKHFSHKIRHSRQYIYFNNEKINLKISPSSKCESPCDITLEVLTSKKTASKILRYYFYINGKKFESESPKFSTTLYFSKSFISTKQQSIINKNMPLYKFFNIRAEGFISDEKFVFTEKKKILVKASKEINSTIELISKNINLMGKIQIATTGITSNSIAATIAGQDITFIKDPSEPSGNIYYALTPYNTQGTVELVIANFKFNVIINKASEVETPSQVIQENISSSLENLDMIIDNPKYSEAIGIKGISAFKSMRDSIIAFNNYVKNEATTQELQSMANILNATYHSDDDVFDFVTSIQNNVDNKIVTSTKPLLHNSISKTMRLISSLLISELHAQENPNNLFKTEFVRLATKALKEILTIGVATLFDGMIQKCYISKARPVPMSIVKAESALNTLMITSSGFLVTGGVLSAIGYTGGVLGASALVAKINYDCMGDEIIDPQLIIKNEPSSVINPGETISYDVKCDVGDKRYYKDSYLTKKTSRFDYNIPNFNEDSSLISSDKIISKCTGLGEDFITDQHNISCSTNALNKTQFYKDNIAMYEEFNSSACANGNDSYTVGMYVVDSPSLSCNFTSEVKDVFGDFVDGKQLVFNLTKKWNCPVKSTLTHVIGNRDVGFILKSPLITNDQTLTYIWNYGDGSQNTSKSPIIAHRYGNEGKYTTRVAAVKSDGSILFTNELTFILIDRSLHSFCTTPASVMENIIQPTTLAGFTNQYYVEQLGMCYIKNITYPDERACANLYNCTVDGLLP